LTAQVLLDESQLSFWAAGCSRESLRFLRSSAYFERPAGAEKKTFLLGSSRKIVQLLLVSFFNNLKSK